LSVKDALELLEGGLNVLLRHKPGGGEADQDDAFDGFDSKAAASLRLRHGACSF
jgi:hypothetical protein